MIYAVALLPAAVLAANHAEVTTSDVRKGAAFDNIKASWGKALNIGDFKTNLRCNYDYNDNRDFLKEVNLQGNVLEGSGDDLSIAYDVNHNFKSKNTEVKLTANMDGNTLAVEGDTQSNIKEVSAQREIDVADYKVDLRPSWLVQAKTARVKMMSALGSAKKDRISAQVDYNTDDKAASYELGYSRSLEDGKEVSATFTPDSNELEVEYVDSKFENGATWTAKATVDTGDVGNVMDATKLTLKRSWQW
jgi:hypothetical protein